VKRRTKFVLAGAMALAAVAGSAAAVAATGAGDDGENSPAITGSELDQATAAALAETGGGKVTGTEVGDEEGAYEVEVTLADGSQVDVHLDKSFNVIGSKADKEQQGEHEGSN
jgi:uncharacterized membrane protein YkoI